MVFKGTATRDRRQWNAQAEALGAEVNAHTDKDHTAFHMRGFGRDALAFAGMLADLVRHASFPADEMEREREVLLQEFVEDEDDPMSTAYKLFDRDSFGTQAAAQPVIGTWRTIERLTRAELVAFRDRQYTGANLVALWRALRRLALPANPAAKPLPAGRSTSAVTARVPQRVLEYIAARTNIPMAQIYSVATFYALFNLQPQGTNKVCICRGTACHTRGSRNLLERTKLELGMKEGEDEGSADKISITSPDGKYTLRTVACFGQCALAPVVETNHSILGHVNEQALHRELQALEPERRRRT